MAVANPIIVSTGRRPIIDYVTKDYDGFRQAMLNQIPLLLPNWTDRSETDFGIVLIELFAYVADILSYYQDRVANEAYLDTATQRRSVTELLRLIDYQIGPGLAASAYIHFDTSADVNVTGAQIPYRLKTAGVPGEPDRIFEITQTFALQQKNSSIDLSSLSSLPAGATSIQISHASHQLIPGQNVYFEEKTPVGTGFQIRRSPMLNITAVVSVDPNTDSVSWLPPLLEPYTPANSTLKGNNVVATNGQAITNEPVFVGDGTPSQQMTLSRSPVTHLLRSGVQQRSFSPELQVRVDGILWELVDNLFNSGSADIHYYTTVDENDILTIHFGTGERGAVPPAGSQVQAVYRIGLGSRGNVGAGTLTVPLTTVPQIKTITNPFNAQGGADHESTEEAKISGPGSVISQQRAVTLQDYELLAEAFAGVGKAKARVGLRGGYKVVQVYIAPENPSTIPPLPPSGALRDALKQQLESLMPVNRMAGVDVLDPIYVPVDISVDIYLQAQTSAAQTLQAAQGVLSDLLSFANQDFGQSVRVGTVYSLLYPLQGVTYIILRKLARSDRPNQPLSVCEFADVPIAENELPYQGVLTINTFGGLP
jgi:uncharacterized phage protein gp47/JayE